MKTVKRIFAVLLTVCMVMGLSVSAAAGGITPRATSGTLTITQAVPNATYNVYKMLDIVDWEIEGSGDTSTLKSSVYYLKPDSAWVNFFVKQNPAEGETTVTNTDVAQFVEVTKVSGDNNYYVEWIALKEITDDSGTKVMVIDDAKADAFAGKALEYVKNTPSINHNGTGKAPAEKAEGAESIEVTIEDLPFGYYLVDTNGGAVVALDTFAPEQEIEEKNTAPVIEKKVRNVRSETTESGEKWEDNNTASIGDVVSFKTSIVVGAGAVGYVLHDAMSDGLTFINNETNKISVELYKANVNGDTITYTDTATLTLTADTHYTVKTENLTADVTKADGTGKDTCDFEIEFKDEIFAKNGFIVDGTEYFIAESDKLVVKYFATLNEKAVIAGTGNPNRTVLAYGDTPVASPDTPKLETPPDETTTYTYKFDLVKTNKKNEVLEGATFMLHGAAVTGDKTADNAIKLVEVKEGDKVTGYRVATAEDTNTVTTIKAGSPTITGLGKGTYYLTEITAPDGYKKLTTPATVTIENANIDAAITQTDDGNGVTIDKLTEGTGVQVINVKKSIFPHTGGMGTTIYYLAGGAIIALVAASAVIVFKKRQGGKV